MQFKSSSAYGALSHGYDANNSFQVWAYGQNMLVKSGLRDWYNSPHHKEWTRSTRANNNITVSGKGQLSLSVLAKGDIVDSYLSPVLDIVVGAAGAAYLQAAGEQSLLTRFTRSLIFIKPATLVVVDYIQSREPQSFEFWLHANSKFEIAGDDRFSLDVNGVKMDARFVEPQGFSIAQTDQYDPNPDGNIPFHQWHLTATPAAVATHMRFISIYGFSREGESPSRVESAVVTDLGDGKSVLSFVDASGYDVSIALPEINEGGLGGAMPRSGFGSCVQVIQLFLRQYSLVIYARLLLVFKLHNI